MPAVSRWFIKTALIYLVAALIVGVVMAAGSGAGGAALWLTYLHLFVVGWLTQLIIGVAIWLFPRHSRETPHGNLRLVWIGYGVLNAGLVARAVAEPAQYGNDAPWAAPVMVLSAVLQWLGITLFVVYIWPRVRTK